MIKLKPIALAVMGCGLFQGCSAPPPSRPLAVQPIVRGEMPGNQAASWNRLARFHHERGQLLVTWVFVLEETGDGGTRLIVRARGGPGYHFHGLSRSTASRVVPIVHFIMQRKQLLGIAWRAERAHTRAASYERQPAH